MSGIEHGKRLGDQLFDAAGTAVLTKMTFAEARELFLVALLRQSLAVARGNQCRAARALNIHRNTLSRYLRDLNIEPLEYSTVKRPAGRAA